MKWFLALLLFVVGCGPSITSGNIVDKDFYPEHTDEEMTVTTIGEVTIYGTEDVYYPPKWTVTFENEEEGGGELVKRTIKISQSKYKKLNLGDWYEMRKK